MPRKVRRYKCLPYMTYLVLTAGETNTQPTFS